MVLSFSCWSPLFFFRYFYHWLLRHVVSFHLKWTHNMVSQHTNLFFAYPKITREFPLFEYLFFTTFGYYRYFHADATHGDIEMIKSVLFNLTPYTTHQDTIRRRSTISVVILLVHSFLQFTLCSFCGAQKWNGKCCRQLEWQW